MNLMQKAIDMAEIYKQNPKIEAVLLAEKQIPELDLYEQRKRVCYVK
ncbi:MULTISPECIES: hypothetical protein [Bacillus]|nr:MULTISPECIES: hypothetical protein [Bacillus]